MGERSRDSSPKRGGTEGMDDVCPGLLLGCPASLFPPCLVWPQEARGREASERGCVCDLEVIGQHLPPQNGIRKGSF